MTAKLDQDDKDRFYNDENNTKDPTRLYRGIISEMDMETGACKVKLQGVDSNKRINALITDPVYRQPGNRYVISMSRAELIEFYAKAEVRPDGTVSKLHISDTTPQ